MEYSTATASVPSFYGHIISDLCEVLQKELANESAQHRGELLEMFRERILKRLRASGTMNHLPDDWVNILEMSESVSNSKQEQTKNLSPPKDFVIIPEDNRKKPIRKCESWPRRTSDGQSSIKKCKSLTSTPTISKNKLEGAKDTPREMPHAYPNIDSVSKASNSLLSVAQQKGFYPGYMFHNFYQYNPYMHGIPAYHTVPMEPKAYSRKAIYKQKVGNSYKILTTRPPEHYSDYYPQAISYNNMYLQQQYENYMYNFYKANNSQQRKFQQIDGMLGLSMSSSVSSVSSDLPTAEPLGMPLFGKVCYQPRMPEEESNIKRNNNTTMKRPDNTKIKNSTRISSDFTDSSSSPSFSFSGDEEPHKKDIINELPNRDPVQHQKDNIKTMNRPDDRETKNSTRISSDLTDSSSSLSFSFSGDEELHKKNIINELRNDERDPVQHQNSVPISHREQVSRMTLENVSTFATEQVPRSIPESVPISENQPAPESIQSQNPQPLHMPSDIEFMSTEDEEDDPDDVAFDEQYDKLMSSRKEAGLDHEIEDEIELRKIAVEERTAQEVLSSDDDEIDQELKNWKNIVWCQYTKVELKVGYFVVILKNGIMRIGDCDYVFANFRGELSMAKQLKR